MNFQDKEENPQGNIKPVCSKVFYYLHHFLKLNHTTYKII